MGPSSGRALTGSRLAALAWAGLGAGGTLFTALVVWLGVREIAHTVASAGGGLVWVALFHLGPLVASALGWWVVLPADRRPPLAAVASARWIAESINQLLPALHVGGNVVRARRIVRSGVPAPLAAASVVVDITLHLVAQIAFTALGACLLVARVRGTGTDGHVVRGVVAGCMLSTLAIAAFWGLQRRGIFTALTAALERRFGDAGWSETAGAIDGWIRRLYRDARRIALAEAWHCGSWLLGAGETWLALRFMGHPVASVAALVIESLGEAARTAAFPIPAALGVQEGSFMLVGGLFGLTPEVSVALSLVKRVRELALGIPGLVVWQLGRRVRGARWQDTRSGAPYHPHDRKLRKEGRAHMRRTIGIATVAVLAFWLTAARADEKPDATLTLSGGSVAAGVGVNWGGGTLSYQGKEYPIQVKGLSVGDVGIAKVSGSGKVFNLSRLEDFNGNYTAAGAGAAVAGGASAAVLKNQNGVTVELVSTTQGVKFTAGAGGVDMKLKDGARE